MASRAEFLAGFGIGDAHGDAGQRMADRAGHPVAVIGVRGVHVGFGHAVAFEHGVTGARGPFAMGVGEQRRGAGNEQPHVLGGFAGQRRALQQPGVECRHAHQHGGARHQLDDQVGIELRQEDHRGAREQRDVAGHEQAVGVIDRQRVDQHVLVGEAPVIDQARANSTQDCRASASRPWNGRWCPRCRGSRRGRRRRGRWSRTPGCAVAAASVSDPLPSAPSVMTLAPTLAAMAPMPSAFDGIAHHQRRFGVGDEIFQFVQRVGGVERQIDRAGAHRGEIQHEARHRFFGLRGDAVARLDAARHQHIRHLPGLGHQVAIADALAVDRFDREPCRDRRGRRTGAKTGWRS